MIAMADVALVTITLRGRSRTPTTSDEKKKKHISLHSRGSRPCGPSILLQEQVQQAPGGAQRQDSLGSRPGEPSLLLKEQLQQDPAGAQRQDSFSLIYYEGVGLDMYEDNGRPYNTTAMMAVHNVGGPLEQAPHGH